MGCKHRFRFIKLILVGLMLGFAIEGFSIQAKDSRGLGLIPVDRF